MKRSDTLAKRTANSRQERPTKTSPAGLPHLTLVTAPTHYRFQDVDLVAAIGSSAMIALTMLLAFPVLVSPVPPYDNCNSR